MAQREDVLPTLEMMRESLRETVRETAVLQHAAVEEEVLMGAENINKTCSNALRYTKLQRELLGSGSYRNKRS